MRPSRFSLVVAAVLALTACRHGDDAADARDVPVHISRHTDTTHYVMQAGDIRVASVDSGVDLALLGDTISGGLSEKTLAKVKHDTDVGAVKGTGFGADIEKMVKGSVQSALATRVSIPLSAVKDVHYDGRKIVFEWNGKPRTSFANVHVGNKDAMEAFSAADAQRFVDAVRARKQASTEK